MEHKFSLVIFDLDGTLVDTHQLIFDSFNHVMKKYKSIELTPSEIMSYFGPPEDVCIKNMIGLTDFEQAWRDYLSYYKTHLSESMVFHGIPELLKNLKKSASQLGIFTGKGIDTTEATLSYHKLKDFFDVIVTGSDVKRHKPHPEGIELALRKFNVKSSEAVLIGDSLSDYKAAASAGVHFVAAAYDRFIPLDRFDGMECVKASSVEHLSKMILPNRAAHFSVV
jgi:pyrophosphatase PpaX